MRKIPNYNLYGESARPPWYDAFNFEWIIERSRRTTGTSTRIGTTPLLQFLYIRGGSGQGWSSRTRAVAIEPPCIVVLPAQTVHGFVFSPDVDGLVITAAQRSLESTRRVVALRSCPYCSARV